MDDLLAGHRKKRSDHTTKQEIKTTISKYALALPEWLMQFRFGHEVTTENGFMAT